MGERIKIIAEGGSSEASQLHSLRYIGESLDRLEMQVESSDAAPTPMMYEALRIHDRLLTEALARWRAIKANMTSKPVSEIFVRRRGVANA
jgi:hypothetical protein